MDRACGKYDRQLNIMVPCGTQIAGILRNSITGSVPKGLHILFGPGCAVSAADPGLFGRLLKVADNSDLLLAGRHDLLDAPVEGPGSGTLNQLKNTRTVSSVADVLDLVKNNPEKKVVYVPVGFESCAPGAAYAILEARKENLKNFMIFPALKFTIPPLDAIVRSARTKIQGFLYCGQIALITGTDKVTEFIEKHNKPVVSAGFEVMQLIESLAEVCKQLLEEDYSLCCTNSVALTEKGNTIAQDYINQVFEPADGLWRGLGRIENSSLELRPEFADFDARRHFDIAKPQTVSADDCPCSQVLTAAITPPKCPRYGNQCTPETPVSPCMSSSEGTCQLWFRYTRRRKR